MKILIISQYYKPEAAHIPTTFAHGMAALGHEVTVITGFPNYPYGKVYEGYTQKLLHREIDSQVKILRVPLWMSHSTNSVGRFANYTSFAFSSFVESIFLPRADVTYVYATQMTPALGPSINRLLRGIPFVLHIQDLWPESVTGSNMVSGRRLAIFIDLLLKPWLWFLYRQASASIAIAPTMAAMLVRRGVPRGRIHTISNWADESRPPYIYNAESQDNRQCTSKDIVRITYAGNLGDHQDLETILEAIYLVADESNLQFAFYGSGLAETKLKDEAKRLGIKNLQFYGRVPPEDMTEVYSRSDFQLVTLKDREIFRGTIPSKVQASLYNGNAIITNIAGDVSALCKRVGMGLVCRPGSALEMANTFRQAAAMAPQRRIEMAKRGQEFYQSHMSYDSAMYKFQRILCECTPPDAGS